MTKAYDDGYDSDAEWSQIQKDISNFLNSDYPDDEEDQHLQYHTGIFDFFDFFDFDPDAINNSECELVESHDDQLRELEQDSFIFVSSDQSDLSDYEFPDDVSSDIIDISPLVHEKNNNVVVNEDTTQNHVPESEEEKIVDIHLALGKNWIVSDSLRIFKRMYNEIKKRNNSLSVEYYNVREADKEILITLGEEIQNRGGGIPFVEYLVYFTMLHTAIFQECDLIRRGCEFGRDEELNEGNIKALFFSILQEFHKRVLDGTLKPSSLEFSLDEVVELIDHDEALSDAISKCVKTRVCTRNEEGDEICAVCEGHLCPIEKETTIIATLKCGHEYHDICIEAWLKTENTCPVCKVITFVPAICEGHPCLRRPRN